MQWTTIFRVLQLELKFAPKEMNDGKQRDESGRVDDSETEGDSVTE